MFVYCKKPLSFTQISTLWIKKKHENTTSLMSQWDPMIITFIINIIFGENQIYAIKQVLYELYFPRLVLFRE